MLERMQDLPIKLLPDRSRSEGWSCSPSWRAASLHSTDIMQLGLFASTGLQIGVLLSDLQEMTQDLPVRLLPDRSIDCRLVMFAQLEGNEPAQD